MPSGTILDLVDPLDRLREAGKRVADPLESLAQRVAERVIDLVLDALDLNALVLRIDLNALLQQVDVMALVDRIDLNQVLSRVDMEALVEQTDLGAIIARSTGGVATEALDAARGGAVGLDQVVDGWMSRLFWRKRQRPAAPRAMLDGEAQP